jgi:hypothetical protein
VCFQACFLWQLPLDKGSNEQLNVFVGRPVEVEPKDCSISSGLVSASRFGFDHVASLSSISSNLTRPGSSKSWLQVSRPCESGRLRDGERNGGAYDISRLSKGGRGTRFSTGQ